MPKRKTQAKTAETLPTVADDVSDVPPRPRRTPPWHRQYLRRLSVHGDRERAAQESKVTQRQVNRIRKASPRFDRGVRAALRMALEAHSDRLQSKLMDVAENGIEVPIVSGGRVVTHCVKLIPNLMKMVAEVTVPVFREAKERSMKAQRESVSNISNTLNISLTQTQMEDPETLALMLALSDKLTQATSPPRAIDVTPPTSDDA